VADRAQKDSYRERVVPFAAGDGMALNLINVRGEAPPARGPVLLVHGAGVRANLFRPPVEQNLVDFLIAHGYDVWLENWRASIDLPPNEWTLDQAALHDHPAAVRTVVEQTGCDRIKAIIHCQGSTSFAMSAIAGLVPQVETVISNAVSLHTVVPRWSAFKLRYAVPLVRLLTPYVSPHWGVHAPTATAKLISGLVRLTHRECDNAVCKLVSFTYGSGRPALWRHENLDEATHEWLRGEFADVPLSFFRQMDRCVRRGHLVGVDGLAGLPSDFAAPPGPQMRARFAFFAGRESGCFLPEGQERSHEHFCSFGRSDHTLRVIPGYSHLDIFIGKDAAREIFPLILEELG
jgi:pimeloyl-ACP methyl ester carboxylesterase